METNGHPHPPPADAPARRPSPGRLWVGVGVIGLILTIPVFLILVVFPLFRQDAFTTLGEVTPDAIRSLRVHLLVRPEIAAGLEGHPDVGPYYAAPADFDALLAPLRSARRVDEFEGVRGPFLGEFRILTTDNRPARIRLYWSRDPNAPGEESARLRFYVGGEGGTKYEGGPVVDLVNAADAAAKRGT